MHERQPKLMSALTTRLASGCEIARATLKNMGVTINIHLHKEAIWIQALQEVQITKEQLLAKWQRVAATSKHMMHHTHAADLLAFRDVTGTPSTRFEQLDRMRPSEAFALSSTRMMPLRGSCGTVWVVVYDVVYHHCRHFSKALQYMLTPKACSAITPMSLTGTPKPGKSSSSASTAARIDCASASRAFLQ